MIMDQTGKRIVGEVLGPLDQGQTITLDCLVNGGESQNKVNFELELHSIETNYPLTLIIKMCSLHSKI